MVQYDYADTGTVVPASFPVGTVIKTRWPNSDSLRGYCFVAYADYEFTDVPSPVSPVRIANLVEFNVSFATALTGDTNNTVMTSVWLWDTPRNNRAYELSFYNHFSPPGVDYFNGKPLIGTYTDTNGQQWQVRDASPNSYGIPYFMFAKAGGGDYMAGSVDVKAALQYLTAQNKITDQTVWATGLATGIEPFKNTAELLVSQFSATLR